VILPSFPEFVRSAPCILGEGAVIERLRRDPKTPLDPFLVNSAFIYDPSTRAALERIHRGYIAIGRAHDLPMLLSASTWRANAENIDAAGLGHRAVNADNVRFLQELRAETGAYATRLMIAGLIGPRGNAYRAEEALTVEDARRFHARQSEELAAAKADVLFGITLPALTEALGMAGAMASTGCPYLLGFVVRPTGTLLDGTPLADALARIDDEVEPRPVGYLINCTHPGFARAALEQSAQSLPWMRERLLGLLGNTAALSPEELDGLESLVEEEPARFATAMMELRRDFGLRLLGGCCGTDDRHIRALAARLARV
jgi:S-methylmethionine-dependent homocysteine/selenocysteine methylase